MRTGLVVLLLTCPALAQESTPGELKRFVGHEGVVASATFAPDGRHILSGGDDGTLRLWSVATGEVVRQFEGHTRAVTCVVFSHDGQFAASAAWDGSVRLWEVASGKEVRKFTGHVGPVHSVAFSRDGTYLVSGAKDKTARVWSTATGELVRTLEGHNNTVSSVDISPDGKRIVTGSFDETIRVWEFSSGRELYGYHDQVVQSVDISPDGKLILSTGGGRRLHLREAQHGKQVLRITGQSDGHIFRAVFSPDGKQILSGGADRILHLWDADTGRELRRFTGHEDLIKCVAFSPDGKLALSSSGGTYKTGKYSVGDDNTIRLWALAQSDTAPVAVTPAKEKLPSPENAAVKEAVAAVREIFQSEYEQAKTDAGKSALAQKLIQVGIETKNDPASRYALFLEGRNLAADGGDLESALRAVAYIEDDYIGDYSALKVESVETIAGKVKATDEHGAIAEQALQMAPGAVAADNFDAAKRLLEVAKASGRKARDLGIVRNATGMEATIGALEDSYQEVKAAMATLEKNPTDQKANLTVGRYRCLLKGDWSMGLNHLALGGDGELHAMARRDVARPQEPGAQIKLADGWWALAEKEDGPAKDQLRLRSAQWYAAALPKLSGLSKAKAEKRLTELRTLLESQSAAPAPRVVPTALTNEGLTSREPANRRKLADAEGATRESEEAVEMALGWLAAHQLNNGGWNFNHGIGNGHVGPVNNPGSEKSTAGATAMALLPFLGAGYTHKTGQHKVTVARGLTYLVGQMKQTANGGDLRGQEGGSLYCHGLATIALCEAYAMTKDKALAVPAQQAIKFTVYAQDRTGGGWRYSPGQPGDTSVLGWQMSGLKTAHWAELEVPPATIAGAITFLNSVQTEEGAKYGYVATGSGEATTSIGLLSRIYLGWKRDKPALQAGVEYLAKQGPNQRNMYFTYYANQVMHHWGGESWQKWNQIMRDQLVSSQVKVGDFKSDKGSWWTNGQSHGTRGGRLYETSLSALTLEVYYRHLPLLR